ncbi:hypothetical protein [Noviherbaspirillum sp. Root189]|uniref:hypothetical protein n=1 Tax=Noviherbaspirillum sp. Root189 TaxID=1736487 RepID=UPI000709476D|nr:hypothetical protein [Noviherbaspirillum sp. Root189]KRB93550.1 hypothetical protein ASE07_12705 [Noviherbaspirillum sp. Root189]
MWEKIIPVALNLLEPCAAAHDGLLFMHARSSQKECQAEQQDGIPIQSGAAAIPVTAGLPVFMLMV